MFPEGVGRPEELVMNRQQSAQAWGNVPVADSLDEEGHATHVAEEGVPSGLLAVVQDVVARESKGMQSVLLDLTQATDGRHEVDACGQVGNQKAVVLREKSAEVFKEGSEPEVAIAQVTAVTQGNLLQLLIIFGDVREVYHALITITLHSNCLCIGCRCAHYPVYHVQKVHVDDILSKYKLF